MRDAANIALRGLKPAFREGLHFFLDQPGQFLRRADNPPARQASGLAADKDRIDDRRTGAIDMDRGPHFGGARERGRAGQAGIEDGDGQGHIGIEFVVMVCKDEGAPGPQTCGRFAERGGNAFGEMGEVAAHVDVAGQFARIAGGWTGKFRVRRTGELPQPDVAKIHQLRVLDISEIRGVGEDPIEWLPAFQ